MTIESTRQDSTLDHAVVDSIVRKYTSQPGSIIAILQDIQAIYGYIPKPAILRVSQDAAIPVSDIFGIVTFYSQFRLIPRGENTIKICKGTACHLNAADKIAEAVCDFVGAAENETSPDGKFTIEKVACLGCCSLSPAIMINGEVFGRLTPENVPDKIKEFLSTRSAS